nr:hypothetical protein CFP56_69058 [Quercus suber]
MRIRKFWCWPSAAKFDDTCYTVDVQRWSHARGATITLACFRMALQSIRCFLLLPVHWNLDPYTAWARDDDFLLSIQTRAVRVDVGLEACQMKQDWTGWERSYRLYRYRITRSHTALGQNLRCVPVYRSLFKSRAPMSRGPMTAERRDWRDERLIAADEEEKDCGSGRRRPSELLTGRGSDAGLCFGPEDHHALRKNDNDRFSNVDGDEMGRGRLHSLCSTQSHICTRPSGGDVSCLSISHKLHRLRPFMTVAMRSAESFTHEHAKVPRCVPPERIMSQDERKKVPRAADLPRKPGAATEEHSDHVPNGSDASDDQPKLNPASPRGFFPSLLRGPNPGPSRLQRLAPSPVMIPKQPGDHVSSSVNQLSPGSSGSRSRPPTLDTASSPLPQHSSVTTKSLTLGESDSAQQTIWHDLSRKPNHEHDLGTPDEVAKRAELNSMEDVLSIKRAKATKAESFLAVDLQNFKQVFGKEWNTPWAKPALEVEQQAGPDKGRQSDPTLSTVPGDGFCSKSSSVPGSSLLRHVLDFLARPQTVAWIRRLHLPLLCLSCLLAGRFLRPPVAQHLLPVTSINTEIHLLDVSRWATPLGHSPSANSSRAFAATAVSLATYRHYLAMLPREFLPLEERWALIDALGLAEADLQDLFGFHDGWKALESPPLLRGGNNSHPPLRTSIHHEDRDPAAASGQSGTDDNSWSMHDRLRHRVMIRLVDLVLCVDETVVDGHSNSSRPAPTSEHTKRKMASRQVLNGYVRAAMHGIGFSRPID